VLDHLKVTGMRDGSRLDGPERGSAVLEGICHAFGSARHLDEAASSAAEWARVAVDCDVAPVQIARPDAAGRLRVVWCVGDGMDLARECTGKRREAFRSKTSLLVDLPGAGDQGLAVFPLVCRGSSLGVLEIVAPRGVLEESWSTLSAVASQLAIVFSNLSERDLLRQEVQTLERTATLGRDLVRAEGPKAALQMAAGSLWRELRAPVAIWWGEERGPLDLSTVSGLGSRKRKELRHRLGSLARWTDVSLPQRRALRRRFGEVVDARHVTVFDAGDAILFAGGGARLRSSVEIVGSLLGEVLPLLSTMVRAQQRDGQLDTGLAWTAHELRGPLLGVKAAVESVVGRSEPADEILLRLCLRELEQVVGDTEGILGWAVGARVLRPRQVDVVRLVQEAVDSCRFEAREGKIEVAAPQRAMARVDPMHLRAAVANLVRNALAYSDPGSTVEVRVVDEGARLRVSVRDQGPGVPVAERQSIFDPFVRSGVGSRNGHGSGLGLFITRRVVEAHGGKVWVDADHMGATFHVQLPVEGRERQRFAS
jgi:signal transduction histidine kinase